VIAQKAPLAIHGCKRMILHARDHRIADTLDYVALWNAAFFQREVLSEAMAAIAAKRPGRFDSLPPLPQDGDALELP
jgi:enoyl-CoA hydratase